MQRKSKQLLSPNKIPGVKKQALTWKEVCVDFDFKISFF
ncbi:hypothetical protein M2451_003799 [Dysgonomonas sp. PFB1-18]|nr:hypothetical protein [Dysgonomonas sp. PF1-14]MDH6340850.1 hypothetical protein [Dysgonomonas sp. PF1-16]MDH6382458.1 hypothetical protein [Dysgonomonas sp. PFB1-18]MDH6399807.1 hypothetical protein [Dysgonomonas sp. PF1-23]